METKIEVYEMLHDSNLTSFTIEPSLSKIKVVLETSDNGHERFWKLQFDGVLRLEYETLGAGGDDPYDFPIQIYDVYLNRASKEYKRWYKRLKSLDELKRKDDLFHVTLPVHLSGAGMMTASTE
jgi:hypothetical protein